MARKRWLPLLVGSHAAAALDAVMAIADDIGSACTEPQATSADASLADGRAGLAMLFSYLAEADVARCPRQTAERFLDEAIDTLAHTTMDESFYGGFTGVAWAAVHLSDRWTEVSTSDSTVEIDAALEQHVGRCPWQRDYDLVRGLVGIGVYALERLPSPSGVRLLDQVVNRLDDLAEHSDHGAAWLTAPTLLPGWQRALCPLGHYNLGVAHGLPGALVVLAGACAAGVAVDRARLLLNDAVHWLLSRKLPSESASMFPSWLAPAMMPGPSRLAWCYGDPGIAAALLCAADTVGEHLWRDEALTIARQAVPRSASDTGVRDAGLCHGAAGLAHLFNRFFQATGEDGFADASRFWFARTLAMRKPGTGVGGYRTFLPDADGTARWVDNCGVLTGAAGIALALLAATQPEEPAWDRMLLVSLPWVNEGVNV